MFGIMAPSGKVVEVVHSATPSCVIASKEYGNIHVKDDIYSGAATNPT